MISDNLKWPRWTDVLDVWSQESPPEIEVIQFEIGKHHPNRPWFDRRLNLQIPASSPQTTTAHHLFMVLPGTPYDCLVAYKLNARCRERQEHAFSHHVLKPIFRAHQLGEWRWWTGGAKDVLPPLSRLTDWVIRRDEQTQATQWRDVVAGSARYWRALAEEWALVRLPEYLDPHSAEYQQYEEFCAAEIERRERTEYERLKRKYGG